MHRILRWLGYGAGTLAALVLLAGAALYGASERVLRRRYAVPAHAVVLPTDSASIAEGRRLALLRGCYQGCHGQEGLEGRVFFDDLWVARLNAPNLTQAVRRYSDAELEGIIRHGVRPDGRSVFVMSSEAFAPLSDADLGRILAFLRSAPAVRGFDPSFSMGPLGRYGLLTGAFLPAAVLVQSDPVPHPATSPVPEADPDAYGHYLARTICAECHSTDLRGDPGLPSPNLAVVAAYSPEDFERLMRTGVAIGGRELDLMRRAATERFVQLTEREVQALYGYLQSLH
jgi:mono/diheme cytochrome c family protein